MDDICSHFPEGKKGDIIHFWMTWTLPSCRQAGMVSTLESALTFPLQLDLKRETWKLCQQNKQNPPIGWKRVPPGFNFIFRGFPSLVFPFCFIIHTFTWCSHLIARSVFLSLPPRAHLFFSLLFSLTFIYSFIIPWFTNFFFRRKNWSRMK